jgi:FKBP-type peptidyl-prolyl cis-trans isomerase SlyD
MNVQKNSIVKIKFTLTGENGELLEASEPDIEYLHGGYDNIFPLAEEDIQGKPVGHRGQVFLSADQAFGEYDPSLRRTEPVDVFPAKVKLGLRFEGQREGREEEETILYTVVEINGKEVVVEGNHPLAGKSMVFDYTILGVRQASSDEIAHGHVHGDHGHHH